METFSPEEKKKYLLKKHMKDHAFEYVLDIIGPVVITFILLKICRAEEIGIGLVIAFVFSLGRTFYRIYHYKKEYIDIDVRE